MNYPLNNYPVLYKDNRGVKEADEHYLKTGHLIKETYEQIEDFNTETFDLLKYYTCTECDFISNAGERRQKQISNLFYLK